MKSKIHKRIGALFLSLALCLGMLPMAALAYDYPNPPLENLSIGNTEIKEHTYYIANDGTVTSEGATAENYNVYYDNNTLTLKDAKLAAAIYVPGGTTIELIGENISGSEEKKVSIGIQAFSSGSITITGTGSYDVYTDYEGIATVYADSTEPESKSDIIIEGGTLNTHGACISTRYGGITISGNAVVQAGTIRTGGDPISEEAQRARNIVIEENAQVTAKEISNLQKIIMQGDAVVNVNNPSGMAVSGNRGIEILDNAEVTAVGTTGGLNAFSGPITINSTKKTAVQATTDRCAAISMGQGYKGPLYALTIKSDVAVTGSVGIGSLRGSIVIDGGNVMANVTYIGFANNTSSLDQATITMKNATVDVQGSAKAGLNTKGAITVENSAVTVRGSSYSFYSMPNLKFDETYRVTAGDDEASATIVPNNSLDTSVFQKKYVKIEPAEIIPVTAIHLNQKILSLNIGNTANLTYTIEPDTAIDKTVAWSSDNTAVATVDENGVVTAINPGTATITVTANGGTAVTDTCVVTVTNPSSGGGGSYTTYYTLTFDTNGGSEVASSRRAEYTTIDLTDYTPTREGYAFTGWYADENLTEKITSIRLTRNTTVYAGWKEIKEDPGTGFENPFTDVSESDWFFGDVKFVYQNGLMNGTSSTTFSPDGTTSRGMIVTILWRMAGSPDMEGEIWGYPFQDVDANAYYATAVYWARLNGIADGYGDNTFGPNEAITREQMAVMLYRYAQHKGYDTTQDGMAIREYADYGQISAYALEAMDWANATGIVSGTSESILSPQGQATRAQAAAMLTRFCEQYAEK